MKSYYKLLFFIFLWSNFIKSETKIEITNGINYEKKITVIPFKSITINYFNENIEKIIEQDLKNTGKFNLKKYEEKNLIENSSEITKENWEKLKKNIIIIGKIQNHSNNTYIINYELIDAFNYPVKILIKNQIIIEKKWYRYAAHNISDEIFEKLTGIRGAFRTRITYVIRKKNNTNFIYKLMVSDYDGNNQFTVRISSNPIMSPSWSPDGKKIVYSIFKKNGKSSLIIQTLKTGEIFQISNFPNHNGSPSFSHDGKKIVFSLSQTGSLNLYLIKLTNKKIYQITDNDSNNTEANWMPDNKTILYTSDEGGKPQIYKLNIKNGISERITWNENNNQESSISNDGKFIVMVTSNKKQQKISMQNLKTGEFQFLTNSFLDQKPTISPNGTMIIYSSLQNSKTVLKLISVNKKNNIQLPIEGGEIKFPNWSPYL